MLIFFVFGQYDAKQQHKIDKNVLFYLLLIDISVWQECDTSVYSTPFVA